MMKQSLKILALVIAAATLSACAGPAPKEAALSASQAQELTVSEVKVDVSAIGAQTKGRALPAANVAAELQKASGVLRWNGGPRKTVAQVNVTSVNIINAAQTLMVGGESVMEGTVSLVDAKTQEVIVPATKISSGGGGYTPGGLIGAASMEDKNVELTQLSTEFMRRARLALYNPNKQ